MGFVVAQSNESYTNQTETTCTDSDGGTNYNLRGNVHGLEAPNISNDWTDYCGFADEEQGMLVEYTCDENDYGKKNLYECPNGCYYGACISNKTITNQTINQSISQKIIEKVTCKFTNSDGEQKCYTTLGSITNSDRYNINNSNLGTFSCSGQGSCEVEISGNKERNEKVTWKSSCGGYAYTTLDGEDESISFDCVPKIINETTEEEITNKGFRYAYWECYNGENQKGLIESNFSICQSSEMWKKIANDFCNGKCSKKDENKCGVNSFGVSNECEDKSLEVIKNETIPVTISNETLICKDSCPLDGKCYSFGYRKSGKFCSDIGSFIEQTKDNEKCDNNFECSSNVCVNDKCVSGNLIQAIINWFKKLFGGE